MRMFVMLGILVVGVLFVAGAIHFQQGANNTEVITFDKQKAENLLQEGEQVVSQAEQAAQRSANALPTNAPTTTAQPGGGFFNR